MHDLIIIGAGPAGLSAGLFAGLYGINTIIIGEIIGGELKLAPMIYDYPGVKSIKGTDWLETVFFQLKEAKVMLSEEKVTNISPYTNEKLQKMFAVNTDNNNYSGYSIILAVGSKKRRPNYSGIDVAFKSGIKTTQETFIITDNLLKTNLAGVFAAGNCIAYPNASEQLVDAAAQGAKAAAQAYEYLKKQKPPILWGKSTIPQK
jgi:thioredoxin reductase